MDFSIRKYYHKLVRLKRDLGKLEKLAKDSEQQKRKLDEIYWGMVFNNAITDSEWLHKKTINPGRWAAGYPMLYLLYRVLNETKPSSILEFGLGETTRLTYQYQRSFPATSLTIIEQDPNWLQFYSQGVFDVTNLVILLPISKQWVRQHEVWQYEGLADAVKDKKFGLIIVDGPWGSPRFSRYQVVELAASGALADDFIIILDDCDRKGEQDTMDALLSVLRQNGMAYEVGPYAGAKTTFVVCSPKYKFLLSL